MKPALIIGSTCVDIIIDVDHLPKTQENLRPSSQTMALGGCAYNVAYIMKLLGAPFTFLSPVGGGIFGDYAAKQMREKGFEIPVYLPEQENGCCYCFVEAGGERTFLSCHGVEYHFEKEWMQPYSMKDYSMVYVCGLEVEEPTGVNLVEYLEENPGPEIFFAPGPRGCRIEPNKLNRMMGLNPVLHINELEAAELSGCRDVEGAAAELKRRTGNSVIITLGEKGTYCLEKNGDSWLAPTTPARVVDTIGAGDSHIGSILAFLLQGKTLAEAVRLANQVSKAVVGVKGASIPPKQLGEVLRSLENQGEE